MPNLMERMEQLKAEKLLLQKDIAKGVGLALRTYQYYEKGERIPDANSLIALARFFNVSIDYLVGESDDPVRR